MLRFDDGGGQAQIAGIPDIVYHLDAKHVYTPELADWLLAHSLK